jgi:DNA-binding NarL/FixJ family response regulator
MVQRHLKFIIVDDEKASRYLLRNIIEEQYPAAIISEANDGEAAIDLFEKEGADLMFIDQQMPFSSGTDLVKKLRDRKATIPLVMVTNHPDAKSEAMYAGLTFFVDKQDLPHKLTKFLPLLLPKR